MPILDVRQETYRTLVDELNRVAETATRERAERALDALDDLGE